MIVRLFVGREKSVRALEEVMKDNKEILLVSQKDAGEDDPSTENIYTTGVLASVLQILKLPDGAVKILVEGKARVHIKEFLPSTDFFQAKAEVLENKCAKPEEAEALRRSVSEDFERYAKLNKNVPEEAFNAIIETEEPDKLADTVSGHLGVTVDKKQELLETLDVAERLEKIYSYMQGELSVLRVEKKIKSRVKTQMEKTQREYYLNEQMKAIQKELGDGGEGQDELSEFESKASTTKLSKEAKLKVESELKKLRNMSPMSAEATVVRNYLDWILSIPWSKKVG
jgi:ATP-dependent Lon protease